MIIRSVGSDVEIVTAQTAAWITTADRTLVLRVVGFLEYAAALRYLDELVSIATREELVAIDQLVQDRPEFTIHINLAQPLVKQPTTLLPIDGARDNARRGLAWVMALARIELGAILATFDAHPDPFAVVRPTEFEFAAYQDIALDDAEAHFWALAGDRNVERLFDVNPGVEVLAYIRRVSLAIQFLRVAAQSRIDRLTKVQANELMQQYEQLNQLRSMFQLKVQATLAVSNHEFRMRLKECCRILDEHLQPLDLDRKKGKDRPDDGKEDGP